MWGSAYCINPKKIPCSNKHPVPLFRKCYIILHELLFTSLDDVLYDIALGSTLKGNNLLLKEHILSIKSWSLKGTNKIQEEQVFFFQ